jgi:hypothetical protein
MVCGEGVCAISPDIGLDWGWCRAWVGNGCLERLSRVPVASNDLSCVFEGYVVERLLQECPGFRLKGGAQDVGVVVVKARRNTQKGWVEWEDARIFTCTEWGWYANK